MVKINISLRAEEVEERYFSMEIVTTHLRNHLLQNPQKLYKWKSTTFSDSRKSYEELILWPILKLIF